MHGTLPVGQLETLIPVDRNLFLRNCSSSEQESHPTFEQRITHAHEQVEVPGVCVPVLMVLLPSSACGLAALWLRTCTHNDAHVLGFFYVPCLAGMQVHVRLALKPCALRTLMPPTVHI